MCLRAVGGTKAAGAASLELRRFWCLRSCKKMHGAWLLMLRYCYSNELLCYIKVVEHITLETFPWDPWNEQTEGWKGLKGIKCYRQFLAWMKSEERMWSNFAGECRHWCYWGRLVVMWNVVVAWLACTWSDVELKREFDEVAGSWRIYFGGPWDCCKLLA